MGQYHTVYSNKAEFFDSVFVGSKTQTEGDITMFESYTVGYFSGISDIASYAPDISNHVSGLVISTIQDDSCITQETYVAGSDFTTEEKT